jgi:hypothetical protein
VCLHCHYSFRLHASRAAIIIVTLVLLLAIGGAIGGGSVHYVKWKADERKAQQEAEQREWNREFSVQYDAWKPCKDRNTRRTMDALTNRAPLPEREICPYSERFGS